MRQTKSFGRGKMLLILDKIPFFRDFSPMERERIVEHAHFFVADKDQYIIEESTLDNSFYILMTGTAVVKINAIKKPLADLNPGDFFGEISFVLNTPRSSGIQATATCILLQVDRRLMGKLNSDIREKFKDRIIEKLARLLIKQNEDLKE